MGFFKCVYCKTEDLEKMLGFRICAECSHIKSEMHKRIIAEKKEKNELD